MPDRSIYILVSLQGSRQAIADSTIMAINFKFSAMALLLIYGVLLEQSRQSWGATVCPLFCLQVEYITCPWPGPRRLPGSCNCCLARAPKGCTLHLAGGRQIQCN
ncbi:hypothetical protein Dimus_037492 [Dionaea muscipula]